MARIKVRKRKPSRLIATKNISKVNKGKLPIIVTSRSAPFVADRIAKVCGFHYFKFSKLLNLIMMGRITNQMNLFVVGLYCKSPDYFSQYNLLTRYFQSSILAFAGTDILQIKKLPVQEQTRLFKTLGNNGGRFVSVGHFTGNEVKKILGLKTDIIYFPIQHNLPANPPPLPRNFNIGCYIPPSNANFYGFDVIKDTSVLVPDVRFHLYSLQGCSRASYELPHISSQQYSNLICHKSQIHTESMPLFLRKMSCGLRITKHDGNPMSLAEYNIMGRWFIFNRQMPHCEYLDQRSPERLAEIITDLQQREGINISGKNFYTERHSKAKFMLKIKELYEGR